MAQGMSHKKELVALNRIEGQIRGISRMIEERRYCVDILTQLHSIVGAILGLEDRILKEHLEGCVEQAMKGKSEADKLKKITEVVGLLRKFRRGA